MLSPGEIFGHFEIERFLGEGGMGTVYTATDRTLDRVVALKLVNTRLTESEAYRKRLFEEAKRAARIDSPFVIRIWECDEFDDQPYIAMEYVRGEDFRSFSTQATYEEKLSLARAVLRGVQAAHDRSVIHRDLKPENILVDSSGSPKILDFGLAVQVESDSPASFGDMEGTVSYCSPEQIVGEEITNRSDLFSVGIILYELFTGRHPFHSKQIASTVYSLLYENPSSPIELENSLPVWLSDIIMQMLNKEAGERPDSAGAVTDFVEESLSRSVVSIQIPTSSLRQKNVTVSNVQNLSGEATWDYFCTGFTEEVVNELKRRSALVVSRQPTGLDPNDIQEVFKRCRSDFVIGGSLLKWENKIRLSLTIHADNGDRVLSNEKYEGPVDDLFDLLGRATQTTAEILATITGSLSCRVTESADVSYTAYDVYLRGRSYYQTNRPEDLKRAEEMFRRALEINNDMPLAHAGLSDIYSFEYMAFYDHTHDKIEMAKSEALKALSLDRRLPEAHRSLGRYFQFTGKAVEAEACFMESIRLDPKYAIGYRTLAWLKEGIGELSDALHWARKALELAPADLETLLLIGLIHTESNRFTAAMATLERAIELGPDYGRAHYSLGVVYMRLGEPQKALPRFEMSAKYEGDPNSYIDAGYVHLVEGNYEAAAELFRKSISDKLMSFIGWYYLGFMEFRENERSASKNSLLKCVAIIDGNAAGGQEPNFHAEAYKACALALMGNSTESLELIARLEKTEGLTGEVFYFMARAQAILGDETASRLMLQKTFDDFDGPTIKEARLDPHFLFKM